MKIKSREINIFSMSALDLFASAMGAFMLLAIMALPFFPNVGKESITDLDVVIAIDLTGSMGNQLTALQEEITALTEILYKLSTSFGIGIIGYTDKDLWQPPVQVYPAIGAGLKEVKNMEDATEVSIWVQGLEINFGKPIKGNDWPESISSALESATGMVWRSRSKKRVIIIITDALAKDKAYTLQLAREFAKNKSHSVSVVFSGNGKKNIEDEKFLKELSTVGNGKFIEGGSSMTTMLLKSLL